MGLADRWAEFIYRVVTTKGKLKIALTPVGLVFWVGLSVLLVFASLWLDKYSPVRLFLPLPINIFLSVPLLLDSISLFFIFTLLFTLLNILYLKTVEEKEMEKKFGQEYLKYKESVPMFIPKFHKKQRKLERGKASKYVYREF